MPIRPTLSPIGFDRRRSLKPAAIKASSAPSTLGRVMEQTRPLWPHLLGVLLLTLVSTPLALLLPLPLKMVVDSVINRHPAPQLLTRWLPGSWTDSSPGLLILAAGMLLLIGALMQVQVLLSWMLQTYTGERIVHDFRARLFWHVQRLGLSFHDRRGTADLAYRIQHDAPAIQLVTIQGVIPFVSSLFAFVGMAYVTARMDWKLAVIAFTVSPALIGLSRAACRKTHDGWHEVKELDSSAMSVLTEVLAAVRLVKAFGRENKEDDRFTLRSSRRMRSQLRLAAIQASYYCATAMLITFGTAAALWVGARHVESGVLTLGELLIVMAYMTQLYEPLRTMANKLPELQASLVSIERAFALLDEIPESLDAPGAQAMAKTKGDIEFQNVSFAYPNGRKVVGNVSFRVKPGTRVGILGPTGSGKSTLLSLLTRFYDPTEGRILLDGVDIHEYRLRDLRNQFAIVPQDPVLFSTSIAENIAFARQDVEEAEVMEAAKMANAHDFITRLPNGYQTEVGDRGACLSGGERQRVAIARALLKDSPILILDEPTSAVDSKTEAGVMAATNHLLAGRTSFMIAHRLSTLENCDMLLRFYDGKLEVITEDVKTFLRHLASDTSFSVEELTSNQFRSTTTFFAEHATSLN
jgi:ATP-binding cassette subfamily B protein